VSRWHGDRIDVNASKSSRSKLWSGHHLERAPGVAEHHACVGCTVSEEREERRIAGDARDERIDLEESPAGAGSA
jgi:hypothetical protein